MSFSALLDKLSAHEESLLDNLSENKERTILGIAEKRLATRLSTVLCIASSARFGLCIMYYCAAGVTPLSSQNVS